MQPLDPQFQKLSATGNDFLLVGLASDQATRSFNETFINYTRPQLARRLCNRNEGVGADGLLILHPKSGYDWAWEFFNADGSSAEMCGNAARCAAVWAHQRNSKSRKFRFHTIAGDVQAEILQTGLVRVTMPPLKYSATEEMLTLGQIKWKYQFVNSGVPHAVVEIKEALRPNDLRDVARAFRSHVHFSPKGTNVTFYNHTAKGHIDALTFERGVEDFTLSCGTGAVAAAAVAAHQTHQSQLQVRVPGGQLVVDLGDGGPFLVGPAHPVATFQIFSPDWNSHDA